MAAVLTGLFMLVAGMIIIGMFFSFPKHTQENILKFIRGLDQ
jgi:hypothetical protein